MQAEYQDETHRLALPPGRSFLPAAPGGDSDAYEQGVGRSYADFQWLCAWSSAWLDAYRHDRTAADAAVAALDQAASTIDLWNHWDEPGHALVRDAVAGARDGDPQPMRTLSQVLACKPSAPSKS